MPWHFLLTHYKSDSKIEYDFPFNQEFFMNRGKQRLSSLLPLIAGFVLLTCTFLNSACKESTPDMHNKDGTYNPLYSDKPFALPDSLQYFYNTIDARGIALSGGEFFVYLKYPVFRSEDKKTEKLVKWLDDEIFILWYDGCDDTAILQKRFKANYTAYANFILNSWLSGEETTELGCMQESLAVEVVLNAEVITMKTHHKGYWGGANGDDYVHYVMFDKNYNQIDFRTLVEDGKLDEFNQMLIAEYKKNIVPWRDYDDNYKLNPDDLALIPEGLIVIYFGYAHAEGQPTMLIKPDKFIQFLKPQYRRIYDGK